MKKRQKHNYTSELELKCLLIRIKNRNLNNGEFNEMKNRKINKYVKWFNAINNKKYTQQEIQRKNIIKYRIKDKAIELSTQTKINPDSYEKFGEIVLLMISKILTKPNFSGYTYKDEMYSDAVHKILKYLHNFDHTMISERSGQSVNSFAYISQIIHNSVIYIINTKKKELDNIKDQVSMEIVNHQLEVKDHNKHNISTYDNFDTVENINEIYFECLPNGLNYAIQSLQMTQLNQGEKIHIYIPYDYKFNMEEYNELKDYIKKYSISILRITKLKIQEESEDSDD